MRCFVVLLLLLLQLVATQPLYGLEKALLYSFEDPNDIEWIANVSSILENEKDEKKNYKMRKSLLKLKDFFT